MINSSHVAYNQYNGYWIIQVAAVCSEESILNHLIPAVKINSYIYVYLEYISYV